MMRRIASVRPEPPAGAGGAGAGGAGALGAAAPVMARGGRRSRRGRPRAPARLGPGEGLLPPGGAGRRSPLKLEARTQAGTWRLT
jgi:hypothetical protein